MERSNAELQARPLEPAALLTLWALRDARNDERLTKNLEAWADRFERLAARLDDLQAFLRYILNVAGREAFGELKLAITRAVPEAESNMQTMAEYLTEQGIEKGKLQGKRDMLSRVLERRFGTVPETARHRIDEATEGQLEELLDRALVAGTLDDVLA